jgi:hypothetical protein
MTVNRIKSELAKLAARAADVLPPPADDPVYLHWRAFYGAALGVLAPFPQARQLVEERCGDNEPYAFGRRRVVHPDMRFWLMKETLWAALVGFPDARAALEELVIRLEADRDRRLADCARRAEAEMSRMAGHPVRFRPGATDAQIAEALAAGDNAALLALTEPVPGGTPA